MFGLYGMTLLPTFCNRAGRFVRALADNAWFQSGTGNTLQIYGMVLAHPKVCAAIMANGCDLLVFPGGAAEANKTAEVPGYKGRSVPKRVQQSVRAQTSEAIESLISGMLLMHSQQRYREGWLRRWLSS